MTRLLLSLALLLAPLAAAAQQPAPDEQIVLGLSQNRVAITANFDGSELLIFGAVKRDQPAKAPPLDVIVTVAGPSERLVIHRKERRAGIWVNTDQVTIRSAPSFYAVATSAPLDTALTATEDLRHRITIPSAIRYITSRDDVLDEDNFVEALIRLREKSHLYLMNEQSVRFDQQTLFRTSVALPSNLEEGDYTVRVFLTRQGRVVSTHETTLHVGKVGLEQWLNTLSRDNAPLYGLLAIFIAVLSGWAASEAFRLLRRQ
ncbi:TIGR02186 family protein [Pseudooceanicola sp. CBS1P-1]|uniref:TIGR02186 family protein n=1 Tax=Pseudooceanicola albus TaxID=2692189 RepID=A0A6L7G4V9_9RHOB|nr:MULTISPECIES: TIGR02186 family protein [Pseudooceanicola]MBT9384709.1 TIGR02186 family protein [Pseudooceanicola endophyticus]MXN18410.1 hypothetical protein [Pseudooceanicola albus]